ncbi:uncharacterized protein si:ch211-153l6.6 isoform X1 [Electrophorus electricus]|uniref:uncharacterized protein si:ch211-153l6.6 isoform X1 n=2 Tax=Electrophorus electricus TaxID=8005 RepID=UPI0015D06B3F|nr:uncharacterized protein si:ch211-153l6.6 isoform X1 [Electrophorus electricus]
MNYSRRVGAWLFALPFRFVRACVYCGRLEMISVWLLFLKLLRATTGVKRPNGSEINEGRKDSLNQQQKEQKYLSESVTMETGQLTERADVKDCKTDPEVVEEEKIQQGSGDEVECTNINFPECPDTEKSSSPITEQYKGNGMPGKSESSCETNRSANPQEDTMVNETEREVACVRECVPPPEPDTEQRAQSQSVEGEGNHPCPLGAKESEHKELQESLKIIQETVLEQQIGGLDVSDVSTELCHDNERDDLSECLQVEMAIVSSDSEAEEQWKSVFSRVVDEEESSDIVGPDMSHDSEETSNLDHAAEEHSNTLSQSKCEPEDEALVTTAESDDILEQPESLIECESEDNQYEMVMHYSSLSKIPGDDEGLRQSAKHGLQRLSASTSELDRELPQDHRVIEESKSENVSSEHLDFRTTRQQWRRMEEESKSQLHQPTARRGNCQGTHSTMYTPVRNLERPKRDPEPEGLSLGDYQYTQFSPCSEDSGMDDTSYRSQYDEPETPVERAIRETMEREESFRRERAMSRPSSGDTVQGKPRSLTLLTGRSEPEDRRRMYNTPEDRCRSQRSPSSKTPTFSITTSPSSRSSYHEMVANNVIILEPDSYPASPRHKGKGLLSPGSNRCAKWSSDMSNVIILETSNLIIRSASEFCLNTMCHEPQESTFHKNPFFKLRSRSTQSLVDQEIKVVRQREEEFKRQRAQLYNREKYDTILVSPNLLSQEKFTYDRAGEIPAKCKSSPSSPSKIRKMDRSALSCDQKFPEAHYTGVRRKSALVQRWEAGIFANHQPQD